MPDEMMGKWLEYYDENGLSWLDTAVQASIRQAFIAGGKAVEQMRAADTSPLCPECQCELHLTTAGEYVCRNEVCGLYR